jgi:hypothetical protein
MSELTAEMTGVYYTGTTSERLALLLIHFLIIKIYKSKDSPDCFMCQVRLTYDRYCYQWYTSLQ